MVNQESKAKSSRAKRARINFTDRQLDAFETVFQQTQYPDVTVLETLAERVELPVEKLCTWFQNRRSKFRKQSKNGHIMWMRQQLFSDAVNDTKTSKSAASSVLTSASSTTGVKVQNTTARSTAWPSSKSCMPQHQPVSHQRHNKLPERYLHSAPPSELDLTFDYLNIPPITASYFEELENERTQVDQSSASVCFPSYNTYPYSAWSGQSACQQMRSSCMYSFTSYMESAFPPSIALSTCSTPRYHVESSLVNNSQNTYYSINQQRDSLSESSIFTTNKSSSDQLTLGAKCNIASAESYLTTDRFNSTTCALSSSPKYKTNYFSTQCHTNTMTNRLTESPTFDIANYTAEASPTDDSGNYSDEGSDGSTENAKYIFSFSPSSSLNDSIHHSTLSAYMQQTTGYSVTDSPQCSDEESNSSAEKTNAQSRRQVSSHSSTLNRSYDSKLSQSSQPTTSYLASDLENISNDESNPAIENTNCTLSPTPPSSALSKGFSPSPITHRSCYYTTPSPEPNTSYSAYFQASNNRQISILNMPVLDN